MRVAITQPRVTAGGLGLLALGCTVVVLATMFLTNPTAVGPFTVTGWFLLLFVGASSWFALALYGAALSRGSEQFKHRRELSTAVRRGLLLGGWVTALLALSSLGQLGLRDVLLSGLLLALVELYARGRQR